MPTLNYQGQAPPKESNGPSPKGEFGVAHNTHSLLFNGIQNRDGVRADNKINGCHARLCFAMAGKPAQENLVSGLKNRHLF